MANSPFVDHVRIYFRSGAGGRGVVSWRREKFVPKGGPDGGDGGHGGSIILEGDSQLWTLLDLRYRKHVHADDGAPGSGQKMHGANGKDVILKVPLGTVAIDEDTEEMIGEIREHGERLLLLRGGRGGRGNWHFRTATNQAPDFSEQGTPGREMTCVLELKMLADVGLVGFPNAGKSTLLSVLTAAKPKIADYPFTTLVPNLGIVKHRDFRSFVMADIPGIIEGAHEGRGLGITFLRHIERNSVLLLLVPCTSPDIKAEYKVLLHELEMYNPELLDKDRILAITQTDLLGADELKKLQRKVPKDVPLVWISAVAGTGLNDLKDLLWEALNPEQD